MFHVVTEVAAKTKKQRQHPLHQMHLSTDQVSLMQRVKSTIERDVLMPDALGLCLLISV